MVSSTESLGGIGSIFNQNTSGLDKSNASFNQSSDMYLKLFLTQLQNQDPTKPMEVSDMANQLSQLNSSQQLIAVNKNLQSLISSTNNSQASSLASFINKQVEYLGDTFYVSEGGSQKFSYFADADYENVDIEIRDESNQIIVKIPADKAQGTHDFTWDGKNAAGEPVAAGTYKVSAVSKTADNKFGALSTFLSGIVTGVDFASGANPVVFVGNDDNRVGVDLSRISAVLNAPTTTPTTTTTNNNG